MKFRWLSAAVCTATLGLATLHSPGQCHAQGKSTAPKAATVAAEKSEDGAVVVVAINAIDSLLPNIQHVARMVGAGAGAGIVTTTLNQFAGGLDRTRPFGVFVNIDESGQPAPIGCLPIDDLEQFFDQLSAVVGEPNDLGDGLYEFSIGNTIYAKKVGKWLYVAQSEEALADVAANTGDVLVKMIQKYDVRIQVNPQNIPEEVIDFIVGQMQAGLEQGMAAQRANLDADDADSARATSEQMIAQMQEGIEGTEKMVIGLAINKQEKRTILDFGSQFMADSKYAKQMEKMKASKTTVGGVPQDASMMALQTFQLVAPDEIAQLEKALEGSLKAAFKSIDEGAKNPESAAKAKVLIEKAVDILMESAKLGKLESAVDVSVESDLNIVASVSVADGSKIESLASEISAELAKEKVPVQFKLNTGKHAGFNLHSVSIPLPPNAAEAAKKVFGSSVTMAIATGPKAVHIAVGKNCDASVKSAVDRSLAKPTAPAEMIKMRLVLSQLLNYIQRIEATPISEAMLNAAAAGNDRILVESQSMERGIIVRLSLEDGVMKAIAAGVKAGQPGGF